MCYSHTMTRLFPHSIIDIHIQATTGGVDGVGYFVDSAIVFDVIPVPAPAGLAVLMTTFFPRRHHRRRELSTAGESSRSH